jgi:hypothetical protein
MSENKSEDTKYRGSKSDDRTQDTRDTGDTGDTGVREDSTQIENFGHDPVTESEDSTQVADAGVPGQIQYHDREVDAERAGNFAAGKVDTLNPTDEEDNDLRRSAHQRDIDSYNVEDEARLDSDESDSDRADSDRERQ